MGTANAQDMFVDKLVSKLVNKFFNKLPKRLRRAGHHQILRAPKHNAGFLSGNPVMHSIRYGPKESQQPVESLRSSHANARRTHSLTSHTPRGVWNLLSNL